MKAALLLLTTLIATAAFGQALTDNPKLTELFTVDQSAREGKKVESIDWTKLNKADQQRRQEVHRMLEAGEVRTANDYFHAAMVYQHGQKPDDYLLAHVLTVDAIGLGSKNARWLSAATLDRYLRSISQPQIYGTQFGWTSGNPVWTRQTMDPSLVTDSMRAVVCVASLPEQEKNLNEIKHGGTTRSTEVTKCP